MSSPTRNGRHLGVNLKEGNYLTGKARGGLQRGCHSLQRELQWEQAENAFQCSTIAGRVEGEAGCKHWGSGMGSDHCEHSGVRGKQGLSSPMTHFMRQGVEAQQ